MTCGKKCTTRYWVTTVKPGDTITAGEVKITVQRSNQARMKLIFEVLEAVEIVKGKVKG